MKTYTFSGGSLMEGLKVIRGQKSRKVISLGGAGKGSHSTIVRMFQANPPEIVDGRIKEAFPVDTKPSVGKSKTTLLAKPNRKTAGKILVRVRTYNGKEHSGAGSWETLKGAVEPSIRAYGGTGPGRETTWSDDLLVMKLGSVIHINGTASGEWVLEFESVKDGPQLFTLSDWSVLYEFKVSDGVMT